MFITVPNICEWVLLLFRWYNIRRRINKKVLLRCFFSEVMYTIYGTMYSRMHEVKLWKTAFKNLKGYGLLQADHTLQVFSRLKKTILFQISYLFKGCLPQILLGLFLNTLPLFLCPLSLFSYSYSFFTLSSFSPCTLSCLSKLPWDWHFNLKVSRASCCSSKHSSGSTVCFNHTAIHKLNI